MRFLVTTDMSPRSKSALKHALQLSRKVGRGEVAILYVIVNNYYPVPAESFYSYVPPSRKDVLEALKKFVGPLARKVKLVVSTSPSVSDEILASAKRMKADYIVMSSRGHGAISSFLLGSTTQRVLSKAKTPVIVVH
jgi:nucleotide-binding universal stress UspA family protein